jgi:signal transduction histidine kinase
MTDSKKISSLDDSTEFLQWFKRLDTSKKIFWANFFIVLFWCFLVFIGMRGLPLTHSQGILLIVLSAAGTLWLSSWFVKMVLAPLRSLSQAMDQVAKGDLNFRAASHPASGPLVNLCVRSLNQMLDVLNLERQRSHLLAERLIFAQEEERRRIARDLHDETMQGLTTLRMRIEEVELLISAPLDSSVLDSCKMTLAQVKQVIDQDLKELRHLVFNLRPMLLEDMGLKQALLSLFREELGKNGIHTDFATEGKEILLSDAAEVAVYRISQEIANNIMKHAKATKVSVRLCFQPDGVMLKVEDNGIGFDVETARKTSQGMGLLGIAERASLLSGIFEVHSSINRGASIKVFLPSAVFPAGDSGLSSSEQQSNFQKRK